MSTIDHDIIILGGGHNGLVAACYLAQAGMGVLLLERREVLGGACVTEELFPGYRFSACSYICHMLQTKVVDDLELRKHGFEVFPLEPSRFSPLPDGRSLLLWDDLERSQEEIRRFSKKDAESYPKWLDFWRRAAGLIHAYFLKPPPTISEIAERVRGTKDEALFDQLLTANMKDLVDQFFESDIVKGTLIHAQDVGDVNAPGSAWCYAYIKCNMFSAPENVGIVKGGMGSITQAMATTARERGVKLQTKAIVNHVLVEDGTAIGVVMEDGTTIRSNIVVSNADPKRTFLKLVELEHLDPAFVRRIKKLKTGTAYLKFHAALKGLPDLSAYFPNNNYDPRVLGEIKICPSVEYYEQSWQDASGGRPASQPIMEVQVPTGYDPSMAPPGHHILSTWALYAPVQLKEGNWDQQRQEVGGNLIDSLSIYMPNIREIMVAWSLFTPLDIEQRVGLTDGNIRHLDIIPSQFLAQRPMAGWANYHTPIKNLYLCGAGTHPGGEVTGAPGHNAAMRVLGGWDKKQ